MNNKITNHSFKETDLKKMELDLETMAAGGYSTSPACYHDNMTLELTNHKKFISRPDINKLREKGYIDDTDLYILRKIYYYKFITKYLLEKAIKLDMSIPKEYKRSNYKSRISKLIEQGMIHQYVMNYEDSENHMTSTPGYLTLSQGAKEYIQCNSNMKLNLFAFKKSKEKDIFTCQDILKVISFVQFDVNFLDQEGKELKANMRNVTISARGNEIVVPAIYQFTHDSNMKGSFMIPLPVRSHDGYEKETLDAIQICEHYAASSKSSKLFEAPIYVLVCENASQGHKVYSYMKKHGISDDVPLLFIFDRLTFSAKIMENLSTIKIVGNDFELNLQRMGVKKDDKEDRK